jgi:PAS domain S-box-containing protein
MQRQLTLALDLARMVAWNWDPTHHHMEITGNLADIYGLPAAEYAQKRLAVIHPEDIDSHLERVNAAMAVGTAYRSEFRIIRPDNGQLAWIEERATPILDTGGHLQKLSGILLDVTERKMAEDALNAAKVGAEEAARRTTILQRVTGALTPMLAAADVARIIVAQSAAALAASAAAVYLPEADGQWLTIAGSIGYPEVVLRAVQRLPVSASLPGSDVFREGQPLWLGSNDELVEHYPALASARSATHNEAVAVIPLAIEGHTLGVLALSFAEARPFEPADRDLLLTLAGQCAQALDRTRLYEAEKQARRQLHTDQLQASEARLLALVNSVQDYAIFMLNPDGRVANWNTGAARIKGYQPDEIIGQHFSRFYSDDDRSRGVPERGLAAALSAGRYEAEGWRVRKDGTRFWANVVITPVYNEQGNLMGFAKVTRDLTERRQAEEHIRESERRLAEAQHMARLGSWHWDVAANIVSLSDEMYRIYGLKPRSEQVSYETFMDYVHPDDRERVQGSISRTLQDHQPFTLDHRIVLADGAERMLQAHVAAEVDNNRRLIAITGTGQDITERKEIEDELEQSRERLRQLAAHLEVAREEERARMAREIHDELGGMLTGLKMDVVQMRRAGQGLEPRTLGKLEDFTVAIDQAVQTVRRIASDLRPAVLDDFGLVAAMEWQLGEFERRSGINCDWQSDIKTIEVNKDVATAVFRIFQESLTNVARHALATQVAVSIVTADGHITLQIRDNGRGITREQLQGSSSLGLPGMRERVALLGGHLVIDGSPGQGTNVLVRIPLPASE